MRQSRGAGSEPGGGGDASASVRSANVRDGGLPGLGPGGPPSRWVVFGGDLLSHPVARAVPSALTGLASGFGMEPGVSPSLWPPKLYGDVSGARGPPVLWGCGVFRSYLGNRIVDAWHGAHTEGCGGVASCRLISTGQLHASWVRTSTSSLSTQSSSWEPLTLGRGDLILKRASRLDAFSGYPFRT